MEQIANGFSYNGYPLGHSTFTKRHVGVQHAQKQCETPQKFRLTDDKIESVFMDLFASIVLNFHVAFSIKKGWKMIPVE